MSRIGDEGLSDNARSSAASLLELGFLTRYSGRTVETASGPLVVSRSFDLDARDDHTRINGRFDPPLPDERSSVHEEVRGDIGSSTAAGTAVEKVVGGWVVQHEEAIAARVQEMGGLLVTAPTQ